MRFLKKIFLTGLICWFFVWIIIGLSKLIYGVVEPLRGPLFKIFHFKIFGVEFAVTLLIIMTSGLLIMFLSKLKSNIPFINQFFKFTEMLSEISRKVETGEIKVVLIENKYVAFSAGVKEIINGEERISVFRPFTPNITSGLIYLLTEEEFKKLPRIDGKHGLNILLHGWLSRKKT